MANNPRTSKTSFPMTPWTGQNPTELEYRNFLWGSESGTFLPELWADVVKDALVDGMALRSVRSSSQHSPSGRVSVGGSPALRGLYSSRK